MSAAVRMCYENEIPLVMRGEGTGYTAGAYNFGSGLVLDTTRMNRVLEVDASKGTMTVQSGISIADAREVAHSVGWDLRQYPPSAVVSKAATVGGFLQTSEYGVGSLRYGRTSDFGNIVDMGVIPVTENATRISLDGVQDRKEILGCVRTLGTSAVVSEITLTLSPSQYWVDVGVTFESFNTALAFAYQCQGMPSFDSREMAIFPSSMITASLNQGEQKVNVNFFRNKVPPRHHVHGEPIAEENAKIFPKYDLQSHEYPSKVDETEAIVILSLNEAAIPFMNHMVKERGGHTIYLEHNRGGFGWIESSTWQQAAHRLSKYYSYEQFSHYEIDIGAVDGQNIEKHEKIMESISDVVRDSIVQKEPNLSQLEHYYELQSRSSAYSQRHRNNVKGEVSLNNSSSTAPIGWVDETELKSKDIRNRPAWFLEMIRREDGRCGLIAQINFRTQNTNLLQLAYRLSRIRSGLCNLQKEGVVNAFIDPHQYDPELVFVDSLNSHRSLAAKTSKSRFDPKSLLNPRGSISKGDS